MDVLEFFGQQYRPATEDARFSLQQFNKAGNVSLTHEDLVACGATRLGKARCNTGPGAAVVKDMAYSVKREDYREFKENLLVLAATKPEVDAPPAENAEVRRERMATRLDRVEKELAELRAELRAIKSPD